MSERAYEVDFAITMKDIATHLKLLKRLTTRNVPTPWGPTKVQLVASGVVLICLADSANFTLKSLFGPIAAALAAGNIVVVQESASSNALIDHLANHSKPFFNPTIF